MEKSIGNRMFAGGLALFMALVISGCATKNPDPLEPVNRLTHTFNKDIDRAIIKPVAKGYKFIVPSPFRDMVGNFFKNLDEVPTVANSLLQGKPRKAMNASSRFFINTTVGILGLVDVASYMGLERDPEDFGQTLAVWGYENSPYLVLPILGPTTFRDAMGRPVDYFLSLRQFADVETNLYSRAVEGINLRADLLDKEDVLEAGAVDEYATVRSAYFQRREFLYTDGQSGSLDDEFEEEATEENLDDDGDN